jgi:hypothetical protein
MTCGGERSGGWRWCCMLAVELVEHDEAYGHLQAAGSASFFVRVVCNEGYLERRC